MDFRREGETARDLVREAGRLAKDLQGKVAVRDKGAGEGLVTEADLAVERLILARLAAAYPDDAILSEETRAVVDGAAERVWCVDPIDGTREYARGGDEFAVQIGLLAGGAPVAGAVGLPAAGEVFWAGRDSAWHDEEPLALAPLARLEDATAIHTRSRRSRTLDEALDKLGVRDRLAAGSVGYKAAQLLLGRAHLYLHTGRGLKWWDTVAPAAVLLAAGGTVTDLAGRPVAFDEPPKHGHGMLYAVPGLAAPAAARLAANG